jgi:hypothetical protein
MESIYANKIIIFTILFVLLLIISIYNSSYHPKYEVINPTIKPNITTFTRLQLKEMKILSDRDKIQSEINNLINTIISNAKNGITYTHYSFNLYETVNDMIQANIMCYDITYKLKAIFIDTDIRMSIGKDIKINKKTQSSQAIQLLSIVPLYNYYCIVTVDTK